MKIVGKNKNEFYLISDGKPIRVHERLVKKQAGVLYVENPLRAKVVDGVLVPSEKKIYII